MGCSPAPDPIGSGAAQCTRGAREMTVTSRGAGSVDVFVSVRVFDSRDTEAWAFRRPAIVSAFRRSPFAA
jgi:hypothetical protein